MNTTPALLFSFFAALCLNGCSQDDKEARDAVSGMRQTHFPGMVTAGGGSSGVVLAAAKAKGEKVKEAATSGGTPFHAGGAGGNPGGTATAGTVAETGHGPTAAPAPAKP